MRGIVTRNELDPLVEWRLRINFFGSEVLSNALRDLMSGRRVSSRDGDLEISWEGEANAQSPTITTTLRIPDAPYVADLVMRPLAEGEKIKGKVAASPVPCPDRWTKAEGDFVHWELFNCMIYTLTSRAN